MKIKYLIFLHFVNATMICNCIAKSSQKTGPVQDSVDATRGSQQQPKMAMDVPNSKDTFPMCAAWGTVGSVPWLGVSSAIVVLCNVMPQIMAQEGRGDSTNTNLDLQNAWLLDTIIYTHTHTHTWTTAVSYNSSIILHSRQTTIGSELQPHDQINRRPGPAQFQSVSLNPEDEQKGKEASEMHTTNYTAPLSQRGSTARGGCNG